MALSASGLGSGMDISGLVTQLVAAERAGSDLQLTRDTNKINTKLSALGSFKGALSGLKTSMAGINSLQSYSKRTTTSSDSAAISATAKDTASVNSYTMNVNYLAEAHALASRSFADVGTTTIGTGTISFRFGSTDYDAGTDTYNGFTNKPDTNVTTLTIDNTNNTLEGLMKAINKAGFGVNASIVNAGDGFKLLLASEKTGVVNSMQITVADGDNDNTNTGASAGLSNFAFNASATNMNQSTAAKDASFSINGLALTSASNTVENAIAGVDVTLRKTTTAPVTVGIKKDYTAALTAVQGFISGYNNFRKTLNGLTSYDASKDKAGSLLGDFSVRSITSQLDNILRGEVENLTGEFNTLADIGIKTDSAGMYSLNTTKFTELLDSVADQLPKTFLENGEATDSEISFKKSSGDTGIGIYAVNISAVASAGSYNSAGVLPDFTPGNYLTLDSSNNSVNFEIDGVATGLLSLTEAEYQTGDALAAEIQAHINGAANITKAGVKVTVSYDASNTRFNLVSGSVGTTSTVKVLAVGTNVATQLGFAVGNGTAGTNVAGTINGKAATGAGKVLTAGNLSTANGLQLTIDGTATGARGTVNYTRGISNQLNMFIEKMLDDDGALDGRIDNFNARLKAVEAKRARQEIRWAAVKDRYAKQFNTLDSLISKLNTTGSFLTNQLASLPGVVEK